MMNATERVDNEDSPKPSTSVRRRFIDSTKDTASDKYKFAVNWIKNIVGAGEARTFDGNTTRFAEKQRELKGIEEKYENFSLQGGNRMQNEDERDSSVDMKSLQILRQALDGLDNDHELRRKNRTPDQLEVLMEASLKEDLKKFIEEEEKRLRKGNADFISSNYEKNAKEIESIESKNIDEIKYRILFSLIFFGALDILEITGSVLDNFGGEFSDSVGKVLRDNDSMGAFADINKAFGVDKIFEGLSQFPILNDINQFGVDALSTEYTQPFAQMANSLIKSEGIELAFKGAILAYQLSNEVDLYKEYSKTQKKIGDGLKEIESEVGANADMVVEKMAEKIIEKQENTRLDIIYLRNSLREKGAGEDSFLKSINKNMSSMMKIVNAKIICPNSEEKNILSWLLDISSAQDKEESAKKLQTFIVLLTLPENIESLKVLKEVIKKSSEQDGDEIKGEKRNLLKQFVTDSNYKQFKSLLAESSENFSMDDESSKDKFIEKVLNLPRVECDEAIIKIAKIARKDEVVFKIKENSFQSDVSDQHYRQQKARVDALAQRVLNNTQPILI